ncbi:MAG: alpha/beta hydrolase [Brucellaceae bacterium]|jgi:pimeloyl-ACP methyl ester carboxylesterase|nr:alpha/beta hydrolase [Brucellaceae bacterium]
MFRNSTAGIIGLLLSVVAFSVSAEEQKTVKRADGSVISWYLDKPQTTEKTGLIILAQGSGCQSVTTSGNMKLARSAFADFTALTVDKYGVETGDNPPDPFDKDCSASFRAHHTMTQRVDDYRRVLESLQQEPWWNGQLVLFGGSEGGDIAARLAAEVKADAVILLSTGGGTTFGEMVKQSMEGEMLLNNVPKDQWPQVDKEFAHARANPQSSEKWAGSSYRFWADAIDHRPVDAMLKSDAALLLIQGSADTSTPVSNARMTLDEFEKAKRCNLTYWEFAGYGHGMQDTQGKSRMADVLAQANFWLRQQLAGEKPVISCGAQ